MINLLLVDDNKDFLNIVSNCLKYKMLNINIMLSYNVEEALNKIEKNEVDLICSDYDMGNTNGLELLKYLRNNENNVKFIMLTGNDDFELKSEVENLNGIFMEKGNGNIVNIIKEEIYNLGKSL